SNELSLQIYQQESFLSVQSAHALPRTPPESISVRGSPNFPREIGGVRRIILPAQVARPKSHELVDNLDRLSLGSFFESPDTWLDSVLTVHIREEQNRQTTPLAATLLRLPERLKPCTQRDMQPTPRRCSAGACLSLEFHSSPKKHHPH